jgi:hypothetical protein
MATNISSKENRCEPGEARSTGVGRPKRMKHYQQYYQILVKSAEAIRQRPSVWPYILVRFAENIPVCLLTVLTAFLAALGLILPPKNPRARGGLWNRRSCAWSCFLRHLLQENVHERLFSMLARPLIGFALQNRLAVHASGRKCRQRIATVIATV